MFPELLVALVPRTRAHLVRYHGLFAPNAKYRRHIVPTGTSTAVPDNGQGASADTSESKPTAPMRWMQCLRWVFGIDLQSCPRCGGPLRVIAVITEPALIARLLEHRDALDDFRGKGPAGGARAPPGVVLQLNYGHICPIIPL